MTTPVLLIFQYTVQCLNLHSLCRRRDNSLIRKLVFKYHTWLLLFLFALKSILSSRLDQQAWTGALTAHIISVIASEVSQSLQLTDMSHGGYSQALQHHSSFLVLLVSNPPAYFMVALLGTCCTTLLRLSTSLSLCHQLTGGYTWSCLLCTHSAGPYGTTQYCNSTLSWLATLLLRPLALLCPHVG